MEMKVKLPKNKNNNPVSTPPTADNPAYSIRLQVEQARKVQQMWEQFSFSRRKKVVERMSGIISFYADRIACAIADCTGKTRMDALSTEVIPSAMAAAWYAKSAKKFLKQKRAGSGNIIFSYKHSTVIHEPWGVVAIVSPWNYPFSIAFHEIAAALMSGNAVLLKLASLARPLTCWFTRIFMEAGVPKHLVQFVNIEGAKAGPAFLQAGIDKLFFTGSATVGKQLFKQSAQSLLPLCLELGGNDAMIVCADANLERAANGALWAGLSNAGQSCGAVERIYVHESVAEEFTRLLCEKLKTLRIGRETEFDIDIGTLSSVSQYIAVENHIEDAVKKGATIAARVGKADKSILLYPAVIVTNTRPDMLIMKEETFGPVLPVVTVSSDDQAIELANSTAYGLTASVWSKKTGKAKQIAAALKAGTVTINDHLMSHALAGLSWGGYKQSGTGRTHGEAGFHEMTRQKTVISDLLHRFPKSFWWYPHSFKKYLNVKGIIQLLYKKGLKQKLDGLKKLLMLFLQSMKK
ncbi:MAG: aldehyde dehydrogenase family protein [Spirochaetales bacterium]|nr:aldehyde dehydrogenase family protein [Spirochaetales bacterium]